MIKPNRVGEYKIHCEDSNAEDQVAEVLSSLTAGEKEIVFVCIGTDRSTGDALGPIIGSRLERANLENVFVHGTVEYPVHATNLVETTDYIRRAYRKPLVVAIDACLGEADSVGMITIGIGSMRPGAGVNKDLPPIGDIYMTGVVNVGGFMEYFVLQNTRLHLVHLLARPMTRGIIKALQPAALEAACGEDE